MPIRKKKRRANLRLQITYVDPIPLKLWDDNPRRNDAAAKRLAPLIDVHGFGQPVTVREEDGVVYKGNTRVKAARLLGLAEVPVIYRSYPNRQDAVDDALADNRAHEFSEWDEDRLADALALRDGVDVERLARRTGFEATVIEGLRAGCKVDTEEKAAPGADKPKHECPKCGYKW